MRTGFLFALGLWLAPLAVAQEALLVAGAPSRLLGGGEAYFMHPRWSPTGDRLAFTGSNYEGLWVADPRGQAVRQLTAEPAAGFGFSWSGDGASLLARVARFEAARRYNAVKVVDVETGQVQQLTDYRTLMPGLPRWSAADARVVLSARGTLEVLDSGKVVAVDKQAEAPPVFLAWENRIGRADARAQALQPIAPPEEGAVLNLVTSPDGSHVAFEVMGGPLFVMNTDGTNRIDLGRGHRPQWSPDGRWVVFMVTEDDGYAYTASDLYAARAADGLRVRLTATADALEQNPSWSPDGQSIAYDDRGAIYLLPVAEKQ